jgi:hypothetical protein
LFERFNGLTKKTLFRNCVQNGIALVDPTVHADFMHVRRLHYVCLMGGELQAPSREKKACRDTFFIEQVDDAWKCDT